MAILFFQDGKFHQPNETPKLTLAGTRGTEMPADFQPYSEIGIGKPLCIEAVTIYTGNAPTKLFGGKPDLLLVSSVKGPATLEKAQKAINLLQTDIGDCTYLNAGNPNFVGTPVVYYTPALEESSLNFGFDLIAQKVSTTFAQKLSGLFGTAASMPLFLTAGAKLIAGAKIIGMAGKLAKSLFESKPFMSDVLELKMDIGGFSKFKTGTYLICQDENRQDFYDNYEIELVTTFNRQKYVLVEKHPQNGQGKKQYQGPNPYLILNADGRERMELSAFQPKIASAALISRFYGGDAQEEGFKLLESSLRLHNDMVYVKKIKEARKDLARTDPDTETEKYNKLLSLMEAYKKNIQNEEFLLTVTHLEEGI